MSKPNVTKRKRQNAVDKADRLTDKQRMFVEQYFICQMNATEAALQAGYSGTRAVVGRTGSKLLSHPRVRELINARLAEVHMTSEEVLARMALDARATMEDFVDPGSGVIDLQKAAQARALGSLKRYKTKFNTFTDKDGNDHESTEVEVELYDGQAARRDIAKHLGLFIERNVSLNVDLAELSDDDLAQLAAGKLPARKVTLK